MSYCMLMEYRNAGKIPCVCANTFANWNGFCLFYWFCLVPWKISQCVIENHCKWINRVLIQRFKNHWSELAQTFQISYNIYQYKVVCNKGAITVVNTTRVVCQPSLPQITAVCWWNMGCAGCHLCWNVTDPVVNDSPSIKAGEQTRAPLADLDTTLSNTLYRIVTALDHRQNHAKVHPRRPVDTTPPPLPQPGGNSSWFPVNDGRVSGLKLHVSLFSSAQTGSRHKHWSACRRLDSCTTAKTDLTTGRGCSFKLLERFNVGRTNAYTSPTVTYK